VSNPRVTEPDSLSTAHRDRSPDGIPRLVTVGESVSATQHVTLPGIVTVTRSRALQVPPWALAVHLALILVDGPLGRLLAGLFRAAGGTS
jgi:hypothetical protein